MKLKTVFILIHALLLLSGSLYAENIIVGNGNNKSNEIPYGSSYKYSTTQSIYTADEIGRTGDIKSIAFYVANPAKVKYNSVQIYMGLKKSPVFTSNADYLYTDLTLVYDGQPELGGSKGWEDLLLQTPFSYDGTSDLVVIVCHTTNSSYKEKGLRYAATSISNKCLYRQDDTSIGYTDPTNRAYSYTYSTVRPNIRLSIDLRPTFVVGGIRYQFVSLSKKTVKVVPNDYKGIVEVPAKVNYQGMDCYVKDISNKAFKDCKDLTYIIIDKGIESIGEGAFFGCEQLPSVTIPKTVSDIGKDAFGGCPNMSTVTIQSPGLMEKDYDNKGGLSTIFGQQVSKYIAEGDITRIGSYAFNGCINAQRITIGPNVSSIGDHAFYGCTGLSHADFASIESLCTIEFGDFYANPLYYVKTLYIGGEEVTDVFIPTSVDHISNYAFYNTTNITSISIPSTIQTIGAEAFSGCANLRMVAIDSPALIERTYNSTENIGNIFGQQVNHYSIGSTPTSIGPCAFYGCHRATDIIIGDSIRTIGNDAFSGCVALEAIHIPNSVQVIGDAAFEDCMALKFAEFESIETLCSIEFSGEKSNPMFYTRRLYVGKNEVTDVKIPDDVTSIGAYAFCNAENIKTIMIPGSVSTVEEYAFEGCTGVTNILLDNGVANLGEYSFSGCTSLSTLTIPNSMMKIGASAFFGCNALNDIYAHWVTPPHFTSEIFSNYGNLHIYRGIRENYPSPSLWDGFTLVDDIDYTTVKGFVFAENDFTGGVNELSELSCTVEPEDALIKDVIWTTEDTDIIFLDGNTGKFVGIMEGDATVTAHSKDYGKYSSQVKVHISRRAEE